MKTKLIKLIIALVLCISLSGCEPFWEKRYSQYPDSSWKTSDESPYSIVINVSPERYTEFILDYEDYHLEWECRFCCEVFTAYERNGDEGAPYLEARCTYIYDDDKFDIITTESDLLKIFDIESDNTDELRITLTRVK